MPNNAWSAICWTTTRWNGGDRWEIWPKMWKCALVFNWFISVIWYVRVCWRRRAVRLTRRLESVLGREESSSHYQSVANLCRWSICLLACRAIRLTFYFRNGMMKHWRGTCHWTQSVLFSSTLFLSRFVFLGTRMTMVEPTWCSSLILLSISL